jgi:hypothetical protein
MLALWYCLYYINPVRKLCIVVLVIYFSSVILVCFYLFIARAISSFG